MRLKELLPRSVLIPVGAAGFLLILALAWTAIYFFLKRDTSVYPREQGSGRFRQELQSYDAVLFHETNDNAEKLLQRLEKRAGTQEERLSVLKRRRTLARGSRNFFPAYESAILKALKDFPYSESMAALAVEAAFWYGREPVPSGVQLYDNAGVFASKLNRERFAPLILSYHVLAGSLQNPSGALAVPGIEALLSARLVRISDEVKTDLVIDSILFRILRGEKQGVSIDINNLISGNPQNSDFLRLGAEYFYDNGSPLYAASLFARLGDLSSFSREADALVLAGEAPAARNILAALVSPPSSGDGLPSQQVQSEILLRNFYNLAATAENEREERLWLERLLAAGDVDKSSQAEVFGLLRYTRLYDTERSIAVLEGSKNPLLELELLRRKMDTWPTERWVPEIWLLLGRHPEAEELYRWSAAFFDRQKLYDESAHLLRIAANQQFEGSWVFLHSGLALIREGKHEEGEKLLKEALKRSSNELPPWIIYANLGRLNESRRSISAAAEDYENAAALAGDNPAAVPILLNLSRCYETLSRFEESRQVLERALEIDSENINIRHELGKR